MKFRTDINGLRAFAVIAVVLFHFNLSWVPGGFAGVDVFFVISGFLMTGIIFRGMENNTFSIINFYKARANRIIPALLVVCFVVLAFGWFNLTPLEYKALGTHVATSLTFISNVRYLRESGYFDVASQTKWLLHTWSLSVEWQFYMLYPIILVILKKMMSLANIKRLLIVVTFIGFIFCVYFSHHHPDKAYFLLWSRAWEMMLGGLAFLYPIEFKKNNKKYVEYLGFILILFSYLFVSKVNLWPGYLAIIPVLGAYFIIIANRSDSILTNNVVMQKVGLASYSIYLWHWPIVVFGHHFNLQHWIWVGIPISFGLGFLSYIFIEKKSYTFRVKLVTYLTCLALGVLVLSFPSLIIKSSFPKELKENYSDKTRWNHYTWEAHREKNKLNFTSEKKKILIIGDSQGGDLLNMFIEFGLDKKYEIVTRIQSTYCSLIYLPQSEIDTYISENPYISMGDVTAQECISDMNHVWDGDVVQHADYIYMAMIVREPNIKYLDGAIKEVLGNAKLGAKVYLVGEKEIKSGSNEIVFNYYNSSVKNKETLGKYTSTYLDESILNINKELASISTANKINYIDSIAILCKNENYCDAYYDGKPIYYNGSHTTKYGAVYFGRKMLSNFLSDVTLGNDNI